MNTFMRIAAVLLAAACLGGRARASSEEDPYETYVKTSRDFKPVKQDRDWLLKAWPAWINMPWYYQWTIGYDDTAGKFCQEHGYNGGFTDRGDPKHLDWFNQFKLRFYVDHTAGKGDLYVKNSNKVKAKEMGPLRVPAINAALKAKLEGLIQQHINNVKSSPMRTAYGLDDEISWGSFVKPCMWKIVDDDAAYGKWLDEIYGASKSPKHKGWIGYDEVRKKLPHWTLGTFDASQLMDQWTYNDSVWNNLLGDLVTYANSVDPETPCGFEGGQSPNAFGGYDYAKVMRKVQFLEAYNIGGAQGIVRSFNPRNAIPTVTAIFHKSSGDDIWQTWYYVAHGNRGFIGWVENWFDGTQPKPFHKEVAPHYLEVENKISPLQVGSTWRHDGVALYYSHASIQMSWILDAEAHGSTWQNRNGDDRLGSSHLVRKAWTNMLADEGLQYSYISYVDLLQNGVPKEYKVLILPAAICLSDAEAVKIRAFCEAGGTVIADYLPGCWDQHGKGRPDGGALDGLFGEKHAPGLKAGDVFGTSLWCETDQDANFSYKSYEELMTNKNTCQKDESGFHKAVRAMKTDVVNKAGKGTAVLLNLSPQWYNAYRAQGVGAAAKRETFMKHVKSAAGKRWVEIEGAGEKEFGYEITYWNKDGRTLLFVCTNPELKVTSEGGGNAVGLKTDAQEITLKFAQPVAEAKDERSGKDLGGGTAFKLQWKMNEAAVISFK